MLCEKPIFLKLSALVKRFGDFTAVDEVSIEIEDGAFFSLLGSSGCGKTTILRMIAGFEKPTEGDILINGKSIINTSIEKREIGVVFQNYALFPHMKIYDNIAYGLRVRKKSKKEIEDTINYYVSLMGLSKLKNRYPYELSGGQQQRVALARALSIKPKLLLLDEPLSNLDVKLRVEMREELMRIKAIEKITMVYVTHDQSEALYLADKIAVMKYGKIYQFGTPKEIYYRPENEFTAGFIGETNIIKKKRLKLLASNIDEYIKEYDDEQSFSLRPENIYCRAGKDTFDKKKENKYFVIKGKLLNSRFFGSFSTFVVKVDDENELFIYSYGNDFYKKNESFINLYFNIKDLIPVKNI